MSEMPLISVVVPVYNAEQYIEACIESILNQTYDNLEIIMVNDGSTDSSRDKCLNLLTRGDNIKFYEKSNSGPSDTRNVGIKKSNGNYIMFVDSDDLISSQMVEYLYQLLILHDAELSVCNVLHFSDGETPVFSHVSTYTAVDFERDTAMCSFLFQKEISTSACGKLYSRCLWDSVEFPSGKLFEDNLALCEILSKVERVTYGDACMYGYRHRDNSITTKSFSIRDLDILEIGQGVLCRYEGESEAVREAAIAYQCSNCLRIYLMAPDDEEYRPALKYCTDYLNEHCHAVLKNKAIRFKLRVALLLYSFKIPRKAFIFIHSKIGRWK